MPDAVENDLRLFERFKSIVPVKIKGADNDFGVDTFLRDVSASGFLFRSRVSFLPGEPVSLLVDLSRTVQPLELSGYVVRSSKNSNGLWEVGVEFLGVQFMALQRLYEDSLFSKSF